MGSGEFYDRLEPLPLTTSPPNTTTSAGGVAYPYQASPTARHTPPPSIFSHLSLLYDETALGVGGAMGRAYSPSDRHASSHSHSSTSSSLDRRDISSLDHRGIARQGSHPVGRSHPPHMSRDMGVAVGVAVRHPLSPSEIDYQLYSPTGTGSSLSSRDNTLPRQQPPHYNHHHQRNFSYDSRNSSRFSDASPTVMGHAPSAADAPIRGSWRKDRNRPERGSGRSHTPQMPGLASASPDLVMNGYATLPRTAPQQPNGTEGGGAAGTTPTSSMGAASLENLRLSDSECNAAFRRDNPGRISITKKSEREREREREREISMLIHQLAIIEP